MIGESLGSYRITSWIGQGGMGAVYLAEHALLGRTAAIKVLHGQLSRQEETVARFFNEARAATAIRHPGIVEIFDFGYAGDGSAYIVMEHLQGESLKDRLDREGTLSLERAASVIRQVAGALQAAHDLNIIHRDLKPDNVYLVPDPEVPGGERAKILDFGIAKLAAEHESSFRTQTGALFGTPAYMAPEQCRGAGSVDHRADLYALGCILFEALCGRPPFVGEGGGEVLAAQIYEEPPGPRELALSIPEPLEAIIVQLLDKSPDARFSSARQLGHALRSVTGSLAGDTGPVQTPPRAAVEPPQTTLSSLAGSTVSEPPPSRARTPRRIGLVATLGAAIALAGGVIALGALRDDPEEVAAASETGATTDAAAPAVTQLEPEAETPASPGTADAGAADDGPQMVVVRIASEPTGAEVIRLPERSPVGTTPLRYSAPSSDEPLRFALTADDHEPRTIAVPGGEDSEHTVELSRERDRRPGRADRRDRSERRHDKRRDRKDRERDKSRDRRAAKEDGDGADASADPRQEPDSTGDAEGADPENEAESPLNPFEKGAGSDTGGADESLNPFDK